MRVLAVVFAAGLALLGLGTLAQAADDREATLLGYKLG